MTKRQQKLLDDVDLAKSRDEQLFAIKVANDEMDSERLPLIAILIQQEDDSLDELLIREFFRAPRKIT